MISLPCQHSQRRKLSIYTSLQGTRAAHKAMSVTLGFEMLGLSLCEVCVFFLFFRFYDWEGGSTLYLVLLLFLFELTF